MFVIEKPLPAVTEDGAPYWDGCRQGELRAQRCSACHRHRWPPSILCPHCLADGGEWVKLSGRGTIYSFIVVHRPQHPAFFDDVPYNVAIVELEEGIRLHTNIIDHPADKLAVGLPVEVVFTKVNDEVTLPRFKIVTAR
jgi:uncharacterized OB-fold protein